MKQLSIAEARDQFTALIRDVETEQQVAVTRHGKPVAVVLSIDEYRRLTAKDTSFWSAYLAFREKFDPAIYGLTDADDFPPPRDSSPGREVDL